MMISHGVTIVTVQFDSFLQMKNIFKEATSSKRNLSRPTVSSFGLTFVLVCNVKRRTFT